MKVNTDIVLKPLLSGDAKNILLLVNESRKNLQQYLYWVAKVVDEKTAQQYILERVDSHLPQAEWFKIIFHGQIVGVFGIKQISEKTKIAEVGYWLAIKFHGNGIIQNIIKFIGQYLSHNKKARVLEFRCLENNFASINVAKKSGAQYLKKIQNYYTINNANQDLYIYQLKL